MSNIKFLLLCSCFIVNSSKVKEPPASKLQWIRLEEVSSKIKELPKPVIIDIFTNWCYWCKVMDKETYDNQKVTAYINDHFYAVKMNAETRDTLEWKNKTYLYNTNYSIHDFALYLTNWQASFPTTVIIPNENAEPVAIAGLLKPKEIEPILKYFGEGNYKTESFDDYQKTFKSSW